MDDFDSLSDAATATAAGDDEFDALPGAANPENAQLSQAPALTIGERIRRNLSPLLGPTETQKLQDGVTITDGQGNLQRVYKPLGSEVDRAGFFPAMSKPAVPITKATHSADDGIIAAAAKATYNTAAGFAEFMESPLGVATAGLGSLPMLAKGSVPISEGAINAAKLTSGAQRAVAGGYALDMAGKIPELATQAGTTSVTGTTGQKIEADLGLGVNTVLAEHLAGEATGLPGAVADRLGANPTAWRPQDLTAGQLNIQNLTGNPADTEFGGAAFLPKDEFDDLPEGEAVQTSAFPTGDWPGGAARDEFDELPEAKADEFDVLPTAQPTVDNAAEPAQSVTSEPGAETITGPDEGKASAMPAELGAIPGPSPARPRPITGDIRPPDILDDLDNDGQKINLAAARKIIPDLKPTGLARKYFSAKGGRGPDLVLQGLHLSGVQLKLRNEEALLNAITGAGKVRLGNRARAGAENDDLRIGAQQATQFGQKVLQGKFPKAQQANVETVPVGNLFEGDKFQVQGHEFTVDKMDMDEDGHLTHVRLEDGPKFGVQDLDGSEVIHFDKGSLETKGKAVEWLPEGVAGEDPFEMNLGDDQKPADQLADEAKTKATQDEMDRLRTRRLIGNTVDSTQDMLEPSQADNPLLAYNAGEGAPKTAEQKLSDWADETIKQAGKRLNVGLDPTVLAAYAVKGALLIKNGVADFGRWSAEMVKQFGEDVRPHLGNLFRQAGGLAQGEGLRKFGQKLLLDDEVSPEAKAAVGEYTYNISSNADAQASAKQIIAAHGADEAMKLFANPRAAIEPDLRVVLGGELIDQFGRDYRLALSKGDQAAAEVALAKQVDVADERLRQGTNLAKGLQANKVYGELSTAGILKQADGMFGDAAQNELDRLKPVTDQVRDGFRAANDTAVAGTIRDPKVNEAARAAVNEAVANSADTRKGVVVEVTGAFAESPEIVRQARDQLRGQLDGILQRQGEKGPRSNDQLRAILDDTAKRAAGIAAGHFQGAEMGKTLAEKYQERLHLSPYEAKRLANVMEREYGKMVDAARAKIPARIAAARARQAAPFDPAEFNQTALDKEIARQLKAQNIRLGELVKQHSTQVDATGRSIGERVVKDAGLTGPRADALQAAFDKRFGELATAAKQRALKQLEAAGVKLPKPLKGDKASELIKLTNLGAFTDARFNDVLSKRLDLPVISRELKLEISRRANALQELPKGDLRNRAAVQLLDYVSQQRGLKPWELPMAVWYANVLNPITTPVHILLDNIPNLVGNTITDAFLNPRAITGIPGAFGRGLKRGTLDAAEILKTGIATGISDRIVGSHTLELDPFKGALAPLNALKYVGRVLSAAHVATFRPAYELKSLLIARDAARNEGLRGPALEQRVADILGNTEPRVNAARSQAAAEGLTGLDFRRRTAEIIEQQREAAVPGMNDASLKYARQATYLNKPYGIIGAAGDGLDYFERKVAKVSPVAAVAAKTLIPFKNIVGNMTNEKLNYFGPTAAVRLYWGSKNGSLYGDKISPGESQRIVVKAVLGTAALSAVAAAVVNGKLVITGNGPRSLDQKKQLFAADGWKPNSIKVGNTYYSYLRTPMATALSALGNYLDAEKYNGLDKQDLLARATFVSLAVPQAVVHQGFFKSVGGLIDAIMEPDAKMQASRVQRLLADNAGGFVVPSGLKAIDRIFDPTQYSANDIAGMVRSQIPWVRRENQPVLNALGEPVKTGLFSGDFSSAKPDPLWTTLAAKQAWVPPMPSTVIVGDKKNGPGNFRALTPGEVYGYTKASGQTIRAELLDNLDELRSMPPDEAKKYVAKVTAAARKEARSNFTP